MTSTPPSFAQGADALFDEYSLIAPLLQQQDTSSCSIQDLSQLLQQQQACGSFMVDDWFTSDLHQSGIFENHVLSTPELPQSPPLTASPSKESAFGVSPINIMLGTSTPSTPSSASGDRYLQGQPSVPLFPDIFPAPPVATVIAKQPVHAQQSQLRRLVPIMPKTEMVAAAAAAAAAAANFSIGGRSSTTLVAGGNPANKRKADTDDQGHDDIILKRQRNTDAARRSRLKKLLKMEVLEKRVTELEGENTRLTTRVAVLESEKSGLENKDKDLQNRIRVLEEQLAEAHKALTAKCSH